VLAISWAAVLVAAVLHSPTPPAQDRPPSDALRPADSALSALVAEGMADSPTFRNLVSEIGERRGFVHINWVVRLSSGLGAALLDRVSNGPDGTRRLFIVIRRGSRPDLVAVLGHELQHALEVLSSTATTSTEIEALFRRLDEREGGPPFETRRARQVQAQIQEEVQAARRNGKASRGT
jgi:hypothetical protein